MSEIYDVEKIRTLLREGFIAEELRHFCQVVPEFQPLYDQLPPALDEARLAERIVQHARATSQLEKLLAWARKHNPTAYESHQPYTVPATAGRTVPDAGGVTIGDVGGSIRDATIAERDVRRTSIGQVIVNTFRRPEGGHLAQRNRRAMIERVKSSWVAGVLEKSLHGLAMVELGMVEHAAAVDSPLNMVLATTERPDQALPPGTRILDLYDRMGQSLLILGEPGSGKTTTLLELARGTIARAEQDPARPIPVVLNLSSWTAGEKPVAEWLVDELKAKYHVPSRIGRGWVQDRALLLLLDGLDEVKLERREACVQALNLFSRTYGLKNIVVCSRIADYRALANRLRLQGAVLLQPLTPEQVDAYLVQAGEKLAAVRTVLQQDEPLQELARTPLTLSVMTLAYEGKSVQELEGFASIQERRADLLDSYVERMFRRRARTRWEPYPRQETVEWLAWLARRMIQQAQTLLLLEELQPVWLPSRVPRWLYLFGSRIIGALFIALALMLVVAWLAGLEELSESWAEGILIWLFLLPCWLVAGGAVGLLQALRFAWQGPEPPSRPLPGPGFLKVPIQAGIIGLAAAVAFGLVFGLILGALFGLETPSPDSPFAEVFEGTDRLICGLFAGLTIGPLLGAVLCGLPFGLLFGLRSRWQSASRDIRIADNLSWSWKRFLVPVLGIGLVLGGLTYAVTATAYSRDPGIRLWAADGTMVTALAGHTRPATSVAFSQDGTRIVTAYEDGVTRLWDGDGRLIALLPGHTGAVVSIRFSPDGSRFLTASADGTARLWNVQDGTPVDTLTGHQGWVRSATFSPDGAQILTRGCDAVEATCIAYTARLWDRDGNLIAILEGDTKWITWAGFSPDATQIVTGEKFGTARLWDRHGNLLAVLEGQGSDGPVNFVSTSADGTRIMTFSSQHAIRLWDEDGDTIAVLNQPWDRGEEMTRPELGPHQARALQSFGDDTTRLWDGNGNLIATLEGRARQAGLKGFLPEGARIVTVSEDGTVRLWDQEGQLTAVLEGHARQVTVASLHPDESRLVTTDDATVRLWDAESGTFLDTLTSHTAPMRSISFSPDGGRFVTVSTAGDNRPTAALWPLLGLILGLLNGLRSSVSEEKSSPNRGVWLTARNAALIGLMAGLILALISAVILVLFDQSLVSSLPVVLGMFLFFGLLIALWYGGLDVIQHLVLRGILARRGCTPWRYARFLDYAAERIFLRKVGGGYIFVHRLLMEHFASLPQTRS
jgi:hypothetical protein